MSTTVRSDLVLQYREVARRLCAHQPVKQIARILDRTPATIRRWMRDQSFQNILKEMDERIWGTVMHDLEHQAAQSIQLRAQNRANEAFDVLEEMMASARSETVRYRCATDILEIGGAKGHDAPEAKVAPIQNIQILNFVESRKQNDEFNANPSAGVGRLIDATPTGTED